MIDLHCHLLPGVDDGPADLAASLDQARAHVAAGVDTVVCTPHVNHSYGNTAASIAAAVEELRGALVEADIPLRVLPGAEVSLSRALELSDEELAALRLGGGPWLLLEPPLASDVPRLPSLVAGLRNRGHHILVAHPERCAAFHHDADLLAQLVEHGAIAQVTAGSLAGSFGRTVQRVAIDMVRQGLVHVAASDAHDSTRRGPGLAYALELTKFDGLVDWSCLQVPQAVLDGAPIPDRPEVGDGPRDGLLARVSGGRWAARRGKGTR